MSSTIEPRPIETGHAATVDRSVLRHMPQLDGLRAIALLAVIWSHWSPAYTHIFGGTDVGFLGVQLFFVLSGYLISGILFDCSLQNNECRQDWSTLSRFYMRRLLRIFPLYYFILGLAVLLDVRPFRETWPWHAAYFSNIYYWIIGGENGFGTHLWSLSVEEQFYFFWPMLILFFPKKLRLFGIMLLIFTSPLFRASIAAMHWGKNPSLASWLTPACLDSLGSGALLAYSERFQPASTSSLAKALLVIGLLGYSMTHLFGTMGAWDQTSCAFCFCWLVWRASRGFSGRFGTFLQCKLIGYLGRISYGMYVIHGFSFAFWLWALYSAPIPGYRILARLHVTPQIYQTRLFTTAMMALITITLAIFSFHFYETPINNLKRFFPYHKYNTNNQKST